MENDQTKKTLREQVQDAIHSGRVKMRPKWHFALRAALAGIGGVMVGFTLLYLVSFVLFVLRHNGVLFVPMFGFFGWYAFFVSLPWLLIFFLVLFVVVLEVLVHRYAFAYRRPLLYSALAIAILAVLGGQLVAVTPLHRRMFISAQHGGLPVAGRFYRHYGRPHSRNIHPGVISELTPQGFVMQNRLGESLTVILTRRTRLPLGADFFAGDGVVVFGDRDDHTVHALGVRKVRE